MRLVRLLAQDFRNLSSVDLDTDARFVALYGPNAQGKTNTLEAIWLLATLKPLRARRNRELVRFGAGSASVVGEVRRDGLARRHRVDLEEGRRRAWLDDKVPEALSRYFEGIRAIAFTPQDVAVVGGEPARRRAWLDRAAFTASPVHLDVVRTWRRILDQKGAALREPAPDHGVLDALDVQLARASADLVERRVALLDELAPHTGQVHDRIAGLPGRLALRYRTQGEGDKRDGREARYAALFAEARPREIERRHPVVGPQSDDVEVLLGGRPARTFGSQGQVRSVVLALKLSELLAARARGEVPLFLLDDVGSELDRSRMGRLVEALHDLGAQVFATSTDRRHLDALPASDTRWVKVEEGRLWSE